MSDSNNSTMKTALILGATGAVGKQLLKDLLANSSYGKIVYLGRRTVELDNSLPQDKLVQKVIDFDNLDAQRDNFKDVDDVYYCLGSTPEEAGSKENYVKIDQEYTLNTAKIVAEENKSKVAGSTLSPVHFLYVSSAYSSKNSMLFLFKIKGQTEEALKEVGFEKVSIFQPGYLETCEPRPRPRRGEWISSMILSPLNRLLNLDMCAPVANVGRAMRKVAENASIKPSSPNGVSTSVIGTTFTVFKNYDINQIGQST